MMSATQLNVEFFYRLLYDCLRGTCYGSVGSAELSAWLAHLWIWIIVIGYALSVAGLFFIVYSTMRLFDLRKREKARYSEMLLSAEGGAVNPRWRHIEELANSASASEWREAIIEADIMLDDILTTRGYAGEGVGDKLKSIEPADVKSLQDAWEAHKVRNQIAHEGSGFNLSETLAHRTIARYEAVFREFKEI